jgi:hypothetical protein
VNENRTNDGETIPGLLGACKQRVTNGKHWAALCFLLVTLVTTHAQVQQVMVGGLQYDTTDVFLSAKKIETGLSIALGSTGKYAVIPNDVRDSLLRSRPDTLSVLMAADYIKAELVVFCNVGRIGKLVRSEVVILGGDGFVLNLNGVGYGITTIEEDSTKTMIIDPAILSSIQRAVCMALQDSALYKSASPILRVQPADLTVVGGIDFRETPSGLVPWSLFKEKVSASYDAAQIIVEALRDTKDLVMIDLDTRDSIFAKARLYMIENYNPTTTAELKILSAFEVSRILTGKVERVMNGAVLTLNYQQIQQDYKLQEIARAEVVLQEDSKEHLKKAVRTCLGKLFGTINDSVEPTR